MILVIDDNEGFGRLVARSLDRAGYMVEVVTSGDEGIARLAEADAAGVPYELALIDYRLPGVDGVTLARTAREHGDNTPFILISGEFATLPTPTDISLDDFCGVMGKPVLPAKIVEMANSITGRNMTLPLPPVPLVEVVKSKGIDIDDVEQPGPDRDPPSV